MFETGDEVLHPHYGRAVVEGVKEIKTGRTSREYLIMLVMGMKMEIMIPVDSLEEIGVRRIASETILEEAISILKIGEKPLPEGNWNCAHKLTMEKIFSGDIRRVAEIMKALYKKDSDKGLSPQDKKLMSYAERLLVGEIMVSEQIEEKEAKNVLQKYMM